MSSVCLFLLLLITLATCQYPDEDLPSIVLQENNLEDKITEIFNRCKCAMFYLCDEQNFLIPPEELPQKRVTLENSLRGIRRLRCSNEFYYCCQNKSDSTAAPVTRTTDNLLNFHVSSTSVPQYLPPTTCGRSSPTSSRVTDEFPWLVAISQRKNNQYPYKCGGALIHPRVVLTALHCVVSSAPNSLRVIPKKEILGQNTRRYAHSKVTKIIKHESYNSGTLFNDIALLILPDPLTGITPICLPRPNQRYWGQRCILAGWGEFRRESGKKVRKVDLPIVESTRCQYLLRNSSLGSNFNLHRSFLCAGGEAGRESRQGEGGSPLICQSGGSFVQAGIVSWGVENDGGNVPSLFTNVAEYTNWIEEKLMGENL